MLHGSITCGCLAVTHRRQCTPIPRQPFSLNLSGVLAKH